MDSLSLARVAACELSAAEDAALFAADEKIWALWQIEAARLAALADPAEAAAARRDLAPAFIMCLATIYEGPWLAYLE